MLYWSTSLNGASTGRSGQSHWGSSRDFEIGSGPAVYLSSRYDWTWPDMTVQNPRRTREKKCAQLSSPDTSTCEDWTKLDEVWRHEISWHFTSSQKRQSPFGKSLAICQFPMFRLRLRAKEGVSNKAARDLRRLARCWKWCFWRLVKLGQGNWGSYNSCPAVHVLHVLHVLHVAYSSWLADHGACDQAADQFLSLAWDDKSWRSLGWRSHVFVFQAWLCEQLCEHGLPERKKQKVDERMPTVTFRLNLIQPMLPFWVLTSAAVTAATTFAACNSIQACLGLSSTLKIGFLRSEAA